MPKKTPILLIASEESRRDPDGPFLRFVRDYRDVLRRFHIHSTGGTAATILSTNLFKRADLTTLRHGHDGGVVEAAANVVLKNYFVVIFFSNPNDIRAELPENRALSRACKDRNQDVRFITTYGGAEAWATFEYMQYLDQFRKLKSPSEILGSGVSNTNDKGEYIPIRIDQQTIALVAHDNKKDEMIAFANSHRDFLQNYDRILATGTTGYTLKLLFADPNMYRPMMVNAGKNLGAPRVSDMLTKALLIVAKYENGVEIIPELAARFNEWITEISDKGKVETLLQTLGENIPEYGEFSLDGSEFSEKIRPLASGPRGGDILLAREVLDNKCHAVIFFQDTQTAQPHDPDIRLFERTCQFWSKATPKYRVYATCITELGSAERWVEAIQRNPQLSGLEQETHLTIEHKLRLKYSLKDVVIVDSSEKDDADSHELGEDLADTAARYFLQAVSYYTYKKATISIGIGAGHVISKMVETVNKLIEQDDPSVPRLHHRQIELLPAVANMDITKPKIQSSAIMQRLHRCIGGRTANFVLSGFVHITGNEKDHKDSADEILTHRLRDCDLVFVTGAPWNEEGSLYQVSNHLISADPPQLPQHGRAVGTVAGTFLERDGELAKSDMVVLGIGYEGLRQVASRGGVIFVCGGAKRYTTIHAALSGRLVSVLITTRRSAEALYNME